MNKPEFVLYKGVYVLNVNTIELANFLEKNQRLQHQTQVVTLTL
jgi:hypothetical protein